MTTREFHQLVASCATLAPRSPLVYRLPELGVTTADHDDRVVPGHSYKFTAAMQAAQGCDRPVLIRVATNTSHGYMPTDKRIAQLVDVWAFTGWRTGMR